MCSSTVQANNLTNNTSDHSSSFINKNKPVLPAYLSKPFSFIPSKLHSNILSQFLNKLLISEINEGDLDFLLDKKLCIKINDANIKYYITLKISKSKTRKISPSSFSTQNDIEISASIYDFLQLAARQQDPDTLVFQRRLIMQGNTELGLEIKNFLDGLDLESSAVFSKIDSLLKKGLPLYYKLFS